MAIVSRRSFHLTRWWADMSLLQPGCFDLKMPKNGRVAVVNVSHPKYGTVHSSQGPGARIPRLVPRFRSDGRLTWFSVPHFTTIRAPNGGRNRGSRPISSVSSALADILRASVPESWARSAVCPCCACEQALLLLALECGLRGVTL